MKVGDKIAKRAGGWWGSEYRVGTIARETKTLWVLDCGTKYKKNSRVEVGDHLGRITELTEDILGDIQITKAKTIASCLMDDLSQYRNRIEENDLGKIRLAIKKLQKAKELLGLNG